MINIPYHSLKQPAFVLNLDKLRRNLTLMSRVQKESGAKILLALKGFSMWKVFPLLNEYLSGATASSLNESRLIFEEMSEKAHVYSPAFNPYEINEILKYSSTITFNSIHQWEKYKDQAIKRKISCGLRVNPEYSDVQTDLYNPGNPDSRLGILEDEFPIELPKGIEGLHMHTLCESSAEAFENLLKSFVLKFGRFINQLKWVNFGGGHLMTKKGYDVDHLIKIIQEFRNQYQVEVFLEPGSAVVWDTGDLVAHVLDIVNGRSIKTAILDVSFTAHMPDTLEMPYRPEIYGAGDFPYLYRIGGVSCLAGDFMEPYGFQQPLEIGNQIIFRDMMHYTMVKTTMFNGVNHPAIYTWSEKEGFSCLRQFTFEDFKTRLS
jgi:carboxynorspermidine decarboxylase